MKITPQADSSNPTLSKEKKSWDYDLLSAGLLVVIGWTLTCFMHYSSSTHPKRLTELSVPISLTRTGLPRIIPPFHRKVIRRRDDRADIVVKLYLSLL